MNKTLEYMSCGLPVVAYDLRETRVSAGDAAFYASDDTIESFAETVAARRCPRRRTRWGSSDVAPSSSVWVGPTGPDLRERLRPRAGARSIVSGVRTAGWW